MIVTTYCTTQLLWLQLISSVLLVLPSSTTVIGFTVKVGGGPAVRYNHVQSCNFFWFCSFQLFACMEKIIYYYKLMQWYRVAKYLYKCRFKIHRVVFTGNVCGRAMSMNVNNIHKFWLLAYTASAQFMCIMHTQYICIYNYIASSPTQKSLGTRLYICSDLYLPLSVLSLST